MTRTPVVAYARFSSDNQREESIDAQIRAIKNYCDSQNYNLIKAYADEAKSATTDQRPEFQQMIKDAESGAFRLVVVHKLDRFSRDRYDSAIYKRQLKLSGVRLVSVLEPLDDSPESIILESVLEGMSEYYSRNLSREVLKGLNENALQCKHNGGRPPLGYDVARDKSYIINPREAEAVRLIFDMYAKGHSYPQIIEALRQGGHKTQMGRDFSQTSLNAILANEKYAGVYVYGRTKPQPKNGRRTNLSRPTEDMIKVPGGMPRIIDQATWENVQSIRRDKASMSGKGAARAKEIYLLSGLLKCGCCGSDMAGDHTHDARIDRTYIKYRCGGRKRKASDCTMPKIDRDLIEDAVIEFIEQDIFSDQAVKEITKRLEAIIQNTEMEKRSQAIAQDLKNVETKIDNAVKAVLAGLNSPTITKTLNDLEEQKTALERALAKAQIEEAASPELTTAKIRAYVDRHRDIRAKSRQEQKTVIRTFIKSVTLYYTPDDPKGPWRIVIQTNGDAKHRPSSPSKVSLANLLARTYTKWL